MTGLSLSRSVYLNALLRRPRVGLLVLGLSMASRSDVLITRSRRFYQIGGRPAGLECLRIGRPSIGGAIEIAASA